MQTNSSAWGEFGSRNAYTADGGVHKFSVCSGNKGPWAWQSTGNITVEQCVRKRLGLEAPQLSTAEVRERHAPPLMGPCVEWRQLLAGRRSRLALTREQVRDDSCE